MITLKSKQKFYKDGYTLLENFYNVAEQIEPIQFGIWKIIGILILKYDVHVKQLPFSPETFDFGYMELIKQNRKYGSEIYDAIKQIPAFLRLVSLQKNEALFNHLRNTECSGIAATGYGIRIDNPNEDKFMSLWHYEYRDQLRSTNGIVFWTPLVPITPALGPVQICPKSHTEGLRRSFAHDAENPHKKGVYGMRIENYGVVTPLSKPGDLMLMDFLTLHSSSSNSSSRPRWSIQFRLFDFCHPSGIKINWTGCSANGINLKDVHPELVII